MKPGSWAIKVIMTEIKLDMEPEYISKMTIESIAR
jgi:hypothetical protein